MTETTLDQRGEAGESPNWVRNAALVTFCLILVGTLCVVFTRVVAARIPEQRATLEKLITDRTGLSVQFENVHFAWNLDGTSAVFTRVELNDPVNGRVRVVAPELRMELDTWDFLRHQQFSLGHVTLSSPDIEITGDFPAVSGAEPPRGKLTRAVQASAPADEAAWVKHFTAWATLMPIGRVEVEGARVHLLNRGERVARHSFTLSQAVVSRGASNFNVFGTMLLSQDVGQSLFVSAKLEDLNEGSAVTGELRVIARRVFLDKIPGLKLRGRGTLDGKLRLLNGRVDSANWQASARELEVNRNPGEGGADRALGNGRFDHFTVNGTLTRDANDVLLEFTDLNVTNNALLSRAPRVSARLTLAPGTVRISRTTVSAESVPLMAADLIASVLAPQLDSVLFELPDGWKPTAGELRAVRFDSAKGSDVPGWSLSAQANGLELTRAADNAHVTQLAAHLELDARQLQLSFDPARHATLRASATAMPRTLALAGQAVFRMQGESPRLAFEDFSARSGPSRLKVQGRWEAGAAHAPALALEFENLDRALLQEALNLVAREFATPEWLVEFEQGVIVEGTLNLQPQRDAAGRQSVNWRRSSGALKLAGLTTAGKDTPHLTAGSGALSFSRGNAQLLIDGGELAGLVVTGARLDWPRGAAPRMHASLQGELASPLLRRTLAAQGLARLNGTVAIEADARGEQELRQPDSWRVTARVSDASLTLAGNMPAVEKLAGTVRYANRQLRALTLVGNWLGGPIEVEAKRANARAPVSFAMNGVADAAPLLHLLGQDGVASQVNGELTWNGTAQHFTAPDATASDAWQITLASNLTGIESHLPEPFDKNRARQLAVSAQLRVNADGIRSFEVDGRELMVRGQVDGETLAAQFEVQGLAGELRRAADADPAVRFARVELKRAPALLAAAGAMLPANGELTLNIDDLRHADRSLGAMHASVAQRATGVAFSFESNEEALHQLAAHGQCAIAETRCRVEFTADTAHLATLLRGSQLPTEWPAESLHAAGEISWPLDAQGDITELLVGSFELEAQGADQNHQFVASATLADGQLDLANVQGTGPQPDQVFRGVGRVGLLARDYDLTIDYERVSLAATAVPSPARARVSRAWSLLRGSAARRGWTEAPETKRVQWHGSWD